MTGDPVEELRLKSCDVVCIKSMTVLGWLIRQTTRTIGESRTDINHVGLVTVCGDIKEAIMVEALSTVQEHQLWARYAKRKAQVAIYRPLNLSDENRESIVLTALGYVGRRYGYGDLILHLADWALLGAYVFRRLTNSPDYPICSWLVAHAFASRGYSFGVEPGQAQPDDIQDFMIDTLGRYYTQVRPLGWL